MRSMIVGLSIVGICAMYAPGEAHAQVCLPSGTLPSLDCSTITPCCVRGAVDPDAPVAPSSSLCADAILWNWRNVGDRCTSASLANHQASFNVAVDPDDESPYPNMVCNPDTEFARHYSSAYLIGAIKHESGKTWHTPMDYRAATSGWENDYHPTLTHHFATRSDNPEEPANASNRNDDITFYCPLYSGNETGTPANRAGIFVHEAWHSSAYGGHDWNNQKDWYYPHWKGTPPEGHLDGLFTPSYMPEGAPNLSLCQFGPCPPRGRLSVYQLQFEYLCDLAASPADWVPRMLAAQASERAFMLRSGADGVGFLNQAPIPITCEAAPKIWKTAWSPSADKELQVDIRFKGFMFEWDPFPNESDSDVFDRTRVLKVSQSKRTDSLEEDSQVVDGEVWVKLIASAELLADNETVKVRYNVRFYERTDGDLNDCDDDLNGCNCPGGFLEVELGPEDVCLSGGAPCWRPGPVLSQHRLANACVTDEADPKDYADVDLEFSLNWN